MSDTLLLLHLVGGYFFLKTFVPTSIWFSRLENYHLIFASILPATALAYSSLYIVNSFKSENIWIKYAGSGLLSMLAGIIIPLLINVFIRTNLRTWILKKSITDRLEKFLLNALLEEKSISITLKNHKVYVGRVIKMSGPKTPLKYVGILPLQSGYRERENKRMHLPVNYYDVYSKIKEKKKEGNKTISVEDFEILIPESEIISVNIFDYPTYKEHFGSEKKQN